MKFLGRTLLVLAILLGLGGCGHRQPSPSAPPAPAGMAATGATSPPSSPGSPSAPAGAASPATAANFKKVIGPAVAGMFYPRHQQDLAAMVDKLLAEAKPQKIDRLRGLVCPHAGYPYSGKTAAIGFKQVAGRNFHTVIILGPSHYALFNGAALPAAEAMETPLGFVPLSPKVAELGKKEPFAIAPPCRIPQRPDWWQQSPQRELPPFGEDTPFSWEHSVEVEVPFLQRVLGDFRLVPAVLGQVDPEAVGEALLPLLDDDTLLVASSDLTHYLPYDVARRLDTNTVRAVCSLDADVLEQEELAAGTPLACGKLPILALMHVARAKGWKAKLLDYRNSGDTAGDKDRVVGYSAIAFYGPETASGKAAAPAVERHEPLSAAEQKVLLELARKSAVAAAAGKDPPVLEARLATGKLAEVRACFVTLTKKGELRGCIGTILPRQPLYLAVIDAARSAAVEDVRFPSVTPDEMKDIRIEISLLTVPRRLECNSTAEVLEKLRPGVDGVVLSVGRNMAVFLPQVWEQLPQKEDFLSHLSQKAGLRPTAWKSDEAVFRVYQVEAMKEPTP
jgi:hypothetical protein